jgi:hypothetical protein
MNYCRLRVAKTVELVPSQLKVIDFEPVAVALGVVELGNGGPVTLIGFGGMPNDPCHVLLRIHGIGDSKIAAMIHRILVEWD